MEAARLWFKSSLCLLASSQLHVLEADCIAWDTQYFLQGHMDSSHILVVFLALEWPVKGDSRPGNSLAFSAKCWEDVNIPEPENPS